MERKVLHTCKFSRPGNVLTVLVKEGVLLLQSLGQLRQIRGEKKGGTPQDPNESAERSMKERVKVWQINSGSGSSSLVENRSASA